MCGLVGGIVLTRHHYYLLLNDLSRTLSEDTWVNIKYILFLVVSAISRDETHRAECEDNE